jgi:hypothetical protein
MIFLVDVMQMEDMPGPNFVDLAISSDPNRAGLNMAHGGIGGDGYRIHISTELSRECDCGNEKMHKSLNDTLDRVVSEAPFAFAINRQFLLEALAGIPSGEHAGEIYFHYSARDKAIIITSPDMTRAAVLMPMRIEIVNSLQLPRIEETNKAKDGDFVTATVDLPEEHPTRQGILDGDLLHSESGEDYKVIKVHAIVETLYGSTLEFFNNYHASKASRPTPGEANV